MPGGLYYLNFDIIILLTFSILNFQEHCSELRRGRRPRDPPDLELAARLGLQPGLRDSPYLQVSPVSVICHGLQPGVRDLPYLQVSSVSVISHGLQPGVRDLPYLQVSPVSVISHGLQPGVRDLPYHKICQSLSSVTASWLGLKNSPYNEVSTVYVLTYGPQPGLRDSPYHQVSSVSALSYDR